MIPENPENQHSYIFEQKPVVYASFWQRFGASFIDGLVLIPVNIGLNLVKSEGNIFFNLSLSGLTIVISWLYHALLESGERRATLGKRAMGIVVTDANGNRISFGRATARHFSKIISAIILFIGYLIMLWDDRKQTLHDKIADTLVVNE